MKVKLNLAKPNRKVQKFSQSFFFVGAWKMLMKSTMTL